MQDEKIHKIQKAMGWAIICSETTHVFCCVLPVIVSTLSLLSVVGVISAAPAVLTSFHEIMHDYEIPLIIFSGTILILGWCLYWFSKRLDCNTSEGCSHEPCEPKKNKTSKILKIATVLFFVNVTIYWAIHVPFDGMNHNEHIEHEDAHVDHDHHNGH